MNEKGNALLVTLLTMLITLGVVGIVFQQTGTVAQNTNRSRLYQGAQAAASGAVDYAYAVWLKRISAKHDLLGSGDDLAITGPSFSGTAAPPGTPGYVYTADGALKISALDRWGKVITNGADPDPVISIVPGYPGWWGRTYTYAATARMRPDNGDPNAPVAGARRLFHYTEVPLFQCMFFFQDDLEIYNPANISLKGLIHTNKSLYLSVTKSSDLNIYGQATYVQSYSTAEPPGAKGSNYDLGTLKPPTWANGGEATQLRQVSTIWPMGPDLDTLFSGTTTNPNLTGGYHELIEPPDPSQSDPDGVAKRRLYNTAANNGGLIVQVTGTTINANTIGLTTLDSTTHLPVPVAGKTTLIAAGSGATLTTGSKALSAFASALSKQLSTSSNALKDTREGTKVNVVNVDLGAMQSAIASYVDSFNDVMYIYDSSTGSTLNTVRLKNGATITDTDGLTIASPNPVYIQGDFNTGGSGTTVPSNGNSANMNVSNVASGYTSKPTAVISDAVTLLSNNWSDANSSSSLSSRTASNTTYNVALLGGYLSSGNGNFSGGAVNYPRFLEDWSSKYCTYYGSMVELFPSKSVTDSWQTPGTYYNAPNRRYFFDTKFSSKSPPGSVQAVVLSRGIWTPY